MQRISTPLDVGSNPISDTRYYGAARSQGLQLNRVSITGRSNSRVMRRETGRLEEIGCELLM